MKYNAIQNTVLLGAGMQALFLLPFQACAPLHLPLGHIETVEIALPAPHPALSFTEPEAIPAYTLRWYDTEGNRKERHAVTGSVTIELEKGIMTPILLIPETSDDFPGTLPPAGALYPLHTERGNGNSRIGTDWYRGISAGIAEEIIRSAAGGFESGKTIASHFNWTRFAEKLALLPDPLELDRKRIREAVLSGNVTVYDVAALEKTPVSFAAPPGVIPENTLFVPCWPGGAGFRWPAGNEIMLSAPDGLTSYFSEIGVLVFQVVNRKQVSAFFRFYSLQD